MGEEDSSSRSHMRGGTRADLERMESWLRKGPWSSKVGQTVLAPLEPGRKKPLPRHKRQDKEDKEDKEGKEDSNGEAKYQWTWAEYDEYRKVNPLYGEWCLLLDGLCVVDLDEEKLREQLESESSAKVRAQLQRCPLQETTKGCHYFFLRPAWADAEGYYDGSRQKGVDDKIDLKTLCSSGTRGVVVVAPTPGKCWASGRAPWDEGVTMEEMPRELMERVAKAMKAAVSSGAGPLKVKSPAGDAKHKAKATPMSSWRAEMDDVQTLLHLLSKTRWDDRRDWRDIATALKNEAGDKYKADWLRLSRISSKFDAKEAEKLWETVASSAHEGPRLRLGSIHKMAMKDDPLRYSEYRVARIPAIVMLNWDKEDRGLADVARHLLGDLVKRVGSKGDMYFFDENECRWRLGNEATVRCMVSMALEDALRDLEVYFTAQERTEPDETKRGEWNAKKKLVCERIKYVRKHSGMCNVTSVAAYKFQDDTFDLLLDSHRHLLGVQNGVVDLRTGELRERRPEDMIFTVLEVPYNPEADTSVFSTAVREAMADDDEMVTFMQKLLGYAITGEVSEAVFPVFTANGRNGKGLITQTLRKLMGPFYKEMMTGVIVQRHVANPDAERGKLLGARIAVFNELEPGDKLKMSEVQLLSGCDGIPATPKFRDPLTIEPRHLCILTTNYMPELSEVKLAIVRRLLCVHFPVTFTDLAQGEAPTLYKRQCDQGLPSRLEKSLGGVLAWLVKGAVSWYADAGRGVSLHRSAPAKVTEFSRKYFESQDNLTKFLSEGCELGEGSEYREGSVALLKAYNAWGRDQDQRFIKASPSWLAEKMLEKGYDNKLRRVRRGAPIQAYEGVRLKNVFDALS